MPALDAHRIFLSTVTAEFARYRTELAARFDRVSVKAVFQEEFEYYDTDLVEKLYQLILPCDVLIHFVGAAAGAVANPKAVEDFLRRCEQRGQDFLGFWKKEHGLDRDFFAKLTYTQWEAVLGIFLNKSFMPIQPQGPATDGHPAVKPPFTPAAEDTTAQTRHLGWLSKTIRRYPQIAIEKDGSYLEDAWDKILGFLLRENAHWQQTARQLQGLPQQRIAPTRLISRHTAADFLGREKELALLDDAWEQKTGTTNILSIIAWGGVGKTALLAYWVQSRFTAKNWLNADGDPDPMAYFDWTFYDHGTRGDDATHAGAASLGSFFQIALEHFGDPDPQNPEKKVGRLAALIQARRSLLILDGLEPLQYPPNHPQAGQITDPDLWELLGLLAQRNPGLCLISSRQILTDLPSTDSSPTRQHDLEELPLECAVSLLRKMQIIGTDDELQQAANDYFCHALSLIVLGRFLFVKGGDINLRSRIKLETANENRNQRITRNAWHVLEAYEQWLVSPQGNATDAQALRLTGLFDRPASASCLAALRRAPAIPGLTDALVLLSDDAWNAVLLRLHEAHLIQLRFPPVAEGSFAPRPEPHQVPLDAHPLIREYFAKQLRVQQPESFQEAHSRLYDHFRQATEHRPDTLEGLQPLYQAVVHGCWAGRHAEVLHEVYVERILRGTGADGFFSTKKLGAIDADLQALAAFFGQAWSCDSANLPNEDKAWLLSQASVRLRALGRLKEARDLMQIGLQMRVQEQTWLSASIIANNLSELEVTMGLLGEAVLSARKAIEFAALTGRWEQKMRRYTCAADALYQSGLPSERAEARHFFELAETLQRENNLNNHLLYSVQGFQFCEMVLATCEREAWNSVMSKNRPLEHQEYSCCLDEAATRATQALEWGLRFGSLLSSALDRLTLARVALYRALLIPMATSLDSDACLLALEGLRKSGNTWMLPRGLLTASLHQHFLRDPAASGRCLDEARQIAERGPMPLYLADVHLHRARLFRDKAELARARELIEKHGYWRRKEELEDAEAASVNW